MSKNTNFSGKPNLISTRKGKIGLHQARKVKFLRCILQKKK